MTDTQTTWIYTIGFVLTFLGTFVFEGWMRTRNSTPESRGIVFGYAVFFGTVWPIPVLICLAAVLVSIFSRTVSIFSRQVSAVSHELDRLIALGVRLGTRFPKKDAP